MSFAFSWASADCIVVCDVLKINYFYVVVNVAEIRHPLLVSHTALYQESTINDFASLSVCKLSSSSIWDKRNDVALSSVTV